MRSAAGLIAVIALCAAAFVGCKCTKDTPTASTTTPQGADIEGGVDGGAANDTGDLWTTAAALEPEDLSRLALAEGSSGLVEGATTPERKRTAVHALVFTDDFDGLPLLGEVAAGSDAALALVAADTAAKLAARRRAAVDPEDALEVREGCDRLLAVVKDPQKPKALRARVLSALRMLEDRGCARDLPASL